MDTLNVVIKTILVSVYHKNGLEKIIPHIIEKGIQVYSTGGTLKYLEELGLKVHSVESLTSYPSILNGRVKTLHPKVFGGILAKGRNPVHQDEMSTFEIPKFDCVIVDLYPFEKTLEETQEESTLIEKIDIGGISLIRAAAKNYREVVVIPSENHYKDLESILKVGHATLEQRHHLAREAFNVSSHYDTAIFKYFNRDNQIKAFKISEKQSTPLRYGENPHQQAIFYGNLSEHFNKIQGKDISYNNLTDIHAAAEVIYDFKNQKPTFAILKHTNTCGLSSQPNNLEAFEKALAGDPVSAFGSVIISNTLIDDATAEKINELFYEVLIAPDFTEGALQILTKKKKRILLKDRRTSAQDTSFKSVVGGVVVQDSDRYIHNTDHWKTASGHELTDLEKSEFLFANTCVKHLKSNAIALTKGHKLIGMGCGQTSRVDALKQAIAKAKHFGFSLKDSFLASDAFFPFSDCVEIAHQEGIKNIIQPGGSIRDKESIDYCNDHGMLMVMTGYRHFKH